MKEICNIKYGPDDMHLIDLFLPEGEIKATYIFMHGGGLVGGTRRDLIPLYKYLSDRAIAVASVEYRLLPKYKFPVFIEDSALAVKCVLEKLIPEYHLAHKLFIGGSSAGAFISMHLAFDRHYLADMGHAPEEFAGFIFDAGQPTTHFSILMERGFDDKRCIIDDTAALYYIKDASPMKPLLYIGAEFDLPARNEQNALMRRVLINYGYPEDMIETVNFPGFEHTGYCFDAKEDGSYEYGRVCAEFILKNR